MCMIDDSESWIFHVKEERTAAKDHKCDECDRTIIKCEVYEYSRGLIDGQFIVNKTCSHCQEARQWLIKECGGYLYGGVQEDLEDHAYNSYGGFALGRLIVGMRHKWKKFYEQTLMSIPKVPS